MATYDDPKLSQFLRPDGSIDYDALLTAEMGGDWTTRAARRDKLMGEAKAYGLTQRRREEERVGPALAGAPRTDIAGLAAGSTAEAAPPEAAAAALEKLARKPVMNAYGQDISDLADFKGMGVRPGATTPPAQTTTPLDFERELDTGPVGPSGRDVFSSLDPKKQRLPPATPSQGTPDEWSQPFDDTAPNVIERPTLTGALRQAAEYKKQRGISGPTPPPVEEDDGTNGATLPSFSTRERYDVMKGAKRALALARARKNAAAAVGAMNADARDHAMEAAHEQDANALEKRIVKGTPDAGKAKAVAKKLQTGADGLTPEPERPKFDRDLVAEAAGGAEGGASARAPLRAAQELVTSAAPPDTSAAEAELKAAQDARDAQLLAAQVASQFGHYADVQQGTQTGDRGAILREAAGNPLKDLQAKRALREGAREQQLADEDRALNRQSLTESLAARRQKAQQAAEYADGGSSISARRRALAASLYPEIVARIPPAQFRTMSAADVDTLLGEAQPSKVTAKAGGGGGGMSPAALNAVRNKLPQHLVDTYNAIGRVKSMVEAMGGWAKTKTGIAGGMVPSVFMDDNTRALRQELGGVVARFLQAGGGKSITANEERVLIQRIAADPTSSNLRPEDLERGLAIIERSLAGDTRQALAGVPAGARGALLGDLKIPESWVGQDLQAPVGGARPGAAGGKKPGRLMRDPKTGEVFEVED